MRPSSWLSEALMESMNDIEDMVYHGKHTWGRFHTIYLLSHIIYYILPLTIIIVSVIKGVGAWKVRQTLVKYLQCIVVISKIKHEHFMWIFFYFRLTNSSLYRWRDEKKSRKTLNWFHVLNMRKKFIPLKFSQLFFWPHVKTALFVVPLIVLGKWTVLAGIQIHPKNISTRTNKVHKSR